MKKLLSTTWLCAALALSSPVWIGMTCSPTTQVITYNTLATTGQLVNSAFVAYMDLVVKGKIATNSVPAISASYNEFQSVYGGALVIAQFNPNAVAPSNVVASANLLVSKIALAEGTKP